MTQHCWWWLRHGAVTNTHGRFAPPDAGPPDLPPDLVTAVARQLPVGAKWFCSPLDRALKTAEALAAAAHRDPHTIVRDPDFAEQEFGQWAGQPYEIVTKERGANAWRDVAALTPPAGESFETLIGRIRSSLSAYHQSGTNADRVIIAHAGTIRAALAVALDLAPSSALRIEIEPLSLTRLDFIAPDNWAVRFVNRTMD